ncbi:MULTISPECIES: 2-hydroxymuconate tautomerase [Convivina]|uniref:Tautomerase n=2 Tax=Convivina TaxID=1697027 RepID=A0A2U1DCF0_9LACO|nr:MULTISPECIES: 2-hydroxymuconate tautomerase [Convivina]SDB87297.1 4-oxalocrotonate tautomerase [Leuconostocaceae bacterium R-53105]PVY85242.1 4-oxalocrotonate tautomerase [Convivina intestini]CAH1850031.1 putative tautomerase [Convivina intestini]CAH1850128.1 putative tautomerase [Convivina sp. LMG 32447]CAH1850135.1 putative tautomerase [Convivina sp. LMG 32447]
MPVVQVELLEGRSKEQLAKMVEDVTAAIVKNTGAQREAVHIILREMPKDHYAVGGVLASDR